MNENPKKSLGQHWLHDQAALTAMAQAAEIGRADTVLEIGPGTGSLTAELLERGAKVIAIEFDVALIPGLEKRFAGLPSFQVEPGDIREYDFAGLPDGYKIAANIPYYLTANLMRRLTSKATNKPAIAALLMQREVAERIAAGAGQMTILSVAAQFYYTVSLGQLVPAKLFTPPPKVDSQILILRRRPKPLFDVDTKQFFRLVRAGFAQRRKTLVNNLSGGLQIDRTAATELLNGASIPALARAQAMSLDDWARLYQQCTSLLAE